MVNKKAQSAFGFCILLFALALLLSLLFAAPGEEGDMVDWVIGVPSQAERKILAESFEKAIEAAECIISDGCQKAMNRFN